MAATWNTTLWALQILLAGIFARDGYLKLAKPASMRVQGLGDMGLVFFIGVSESAGALGLILPEWTRILPWLTPVAAVGIAVIMALAIRFHLRRHEGKHAGFTFVLLVLATFVAYGRFVFAPMG